MFQDPGGVVQVNLQTAEVYMRKRMLMPVPVDIAGHEDFKSVFGSAFQFCALHKNDVNRKWITILHGGRTYEVNSWTPITFDEANQAAANSSQQSSELNQSEAAVKYDWCCRCF
jgi:hypothetical protein